jgi:hypothetical protein
MSMRAPPCSLRARSSGEEASGADWAAVLGLGQVALAQEKRLELRRGTWQGRGRGRLPFSRWADEWWELYSTDPDRSPNTLATTESRLRLHLRPGFGDARLSRSAPPRCAAGSAGGTNRATG